MVNIHNQAACNAPLTDAWEDQVGGGGLNVAPAINHLQTSLVDLLHNKTAMPSERILMFPQMA